MYENLSSAIPNWIFPNFDYRSINLKPVKLSSNQLVTQGYFVFNPAI